MALRASADVQGAPRLVGHKKLAVGLAATAATLLTATGAGSTSAAASSVSGPILNKAVVAQAPVDECFAGLGKDVAPNSDGSCPTGYQPKINGSYVWAAARSGDNAFFGTNANAMCQGSAVLSTTQTPDLDPDQNACEFGEGAGASTFGAAYGDVRRPQVLMFNTDTNKLTDISPVSDPLFDKVNGLRAAGSDNNVVFMMGLKIATPSDPAVGLALFAFDGTTGAYLGSQLRTDLLSARQSVVDAQGTLYMATRQKQADGSFSGAVLRWTGTEADPFSFETVATLGNDAAYLTTLGNRLVVSGWTSIDFPDHGGAVNGPAKIWMSPEIPTGGLTESDANSWTPIFSWDQYDPDPVIGKGIEWGALAVWNGDLYVGSYNHCSVTAVETLWNTYGTPSTDAGKLRDIEQANRAATIFRIHAPGTSKQSVQLLYGETTLPVYNASTKTWSTQPNKLGQTPLFGASGFGNPANEYAWTFTVFQNRLYMATFNAAGVVSASAGAVQDITGISDTTKNALRYSVGPALFAGMGGSQVWRMDSPNSPAVPESLNGFGDRSQHGVRVFLPFEDKGYLLAGMAGAYNLRSAAQDRGGWSIDKLTPGAMRAPLTQNLPANAIEGVLGGIGAGVE